MEIINIVPELTKEEREEVEQNILMVFVRIQKRLEEEQIIRNEEN